MKEQSKEGKEQTSGRTLLLLLLLLLLLHTHSFRCWQQVVGLFLFVLQVGEEPPVASRYILTSAARIIARASEEVSQRVTE